MEYLNYSKSYKRAERRFKSECKFKRRIAIYTNDLHDCKTHGGRTEFIESILAGEAFTFLRSTSCPCNCWMCSGENKYIRLSKGEEKKIVEEGLWE